MAIAIENSKNSSHHPRRNIDLLAKIIRIHGWRRPTKGVDSKMIRNICYIRRKLEGQAEELMARAAALADLVRLEDINQEDGEGQDHKEAGLMATG